MFLRFSCVDHPNARVLRSDGGSIPTMEVGKDTWIDVKTDELYCSVSNGDHDHRSKHILVEFLLAREDKVAFAGGTIVQAWGAEG